MAVLSCSVFTTPRRVTFVPMVMIFTFFAEKERLLSAITSRRMAAVIFVSDPLPPWSIGVSVEPPLSRSFTLVLSATFVWSVRSGGLSAAS